MAPPQPKGDKMEPVSATAYMGAAAISGGANITSGLIGGAMQSNSARRIQRHEHRWQEKMRATAYQTAIDDLQKAGLNPALAYSNGGASAGVGSGTASASAPDTNAKLDLVSALTAKKEMENIDKQNELLDEQKDKTKAETKNIEANTKQTDQNININEPDEETSKALKWWNSTWLGKATNVAGDIVGKLSPFTAGAVNYASARQVRKGLETREENKPNTESIAHFNKKGEPIGTTIKRKYKD